MFSASSPGWGAFGLSSEGQSKVLEQSRETIRTLSTERDLLALSRLRFIQMWLVIPQSPEAQPSDYPSIKITEAHRRPPTTTPAGRGILQGAKLWGEGGWGAPSERSGSRPASAQQSPAASPRGSVPARRTAQGLALASVGLVGGGGSALRPPRLSPSTFELTSAP